MGVIIKPDQIENLSQTLHQQNKKIVVVGGCFDILHIGHIEFLEAAKKSGDMLFVLLESDESIKKIKGENRPINTQQTRARMLSALSFIDYIVLLPPHCKNVDYDGIITSIRPATIATTQGDPHQDHKERQSRLVGAKLVEVVKNISNNSTTRIAQLLEKEI